MTPTPVASATPAPEPTATVTPTPDHRALAFVANDCAVGAVQQGWTGDTVYRRPYPEVYFTFRAGDNAGTVSEASDTAKVAGNAAKLSFTDSGKPGA